MFANPIGKSIHRYTAYIEKFAVEGNNFLPVVGRQLPASLSFQPQLQIHDTFFRLYTQRYKWLINYYYCIICTALFMHWNLNISQSIACYTNQACFFHVQINHFESRRAMDRHSTQPIARQTVIKKEVK